MARPGKPVRRGGKGKDKPPGKDSMEAKVAKKLTETELSERGRRLGRKMVELNDLKRRKKAASRAISEEIATVQAECDKLAQEIVHGEEMVRQGDLFAPKYKDEGAPPPAKTAKALAEVAKRAGEKPAAEPPPAPAPSNPAA